MLPATQPTTEEARQLAIVLRDKYLADARQCMKVVREIEKQYNLAPVNKKGR